MEEIVIKMAACLLIALMLGFLFGWLIKAILAKEKYGAKIDDLTFDLKENRESLVAAYKEEKEIKATLLDSQNSLYTGKLKSAIIGHNLKSVETELSSVIEGITTLASEKELLMKDFDQEKEKHALLQDKYDKLALNSSLQKEEIEAFKEDINKKEQAQKQLTQEIEKEREKHTLLKTEYEALTADNALKNSEVETFKENISKKEQELIEIKTQLEDKEKVLEKEQEAHAFLKTSHEKLTHDYSVKSQEAESLKNDISTFKEDINKKEQAQKQLTQEIEKEREKHTLLKTEYEALTADNALKNSEVETFKENISKKEQELIEIKTQLEDKEKVLEKEQEAHAFLKTSHEKLTHDYSVKSQEAESLKNDISALQENGLKKGDEVTHVKALLSEKEIAFNRAQEQNKGLKIEHEKITHDYTLKKQEVDTLKSEIMALKSDIAKKEHESRTIKTSLNDTKASLEAYEKIKKEHAQLQSEVEKLSHDYSIKAQEVDKLSSAIASYKQTEADLLSEKEAQKKRAETLSQNLKTNEDTKVKFQQEKQSYENEISKLKESYQRELEEKSKEILQLKSQNNTLSSNLHKTTSKLKNAEAKSHSLSADTTKNGLDDELEITNMMRENMPISDVYDEHHDEGKGFFKFAKDALKKITDSGNDADKEAGWVLKHKDKKD